MGWHACVRVWGSTMPDDELLDLAPLLGLDALSPAEIDSVHRRRGRADAATRAEFDDVVRRTREAMAELSAVTAAPPPPALRARILAAAHADLDDAAHVEQPEPHLGSGVAAGPSDAIDSDSDDSPGAGAPVTPLSRRADESPGHTGTSTGRRIAYLVAAAVVAIAVGGLGWAIGSGLSSQTSTPVPTAEKVFSASDVRTSSGAVATGRATLTYSTSTDAAVLVMNDVPPPQPGTVYQMWLIGPQGATSAGTMTDRDVAPSTTAVIGNLHDATTLTFTVEQGGPAAVPGTVVASLPLR